MTWPLRSRLDNLMAALHQPAPIIGKVWTEIVHIASVAMAIKQLMLKFPRIIVVLHSIQK